MIKLYVDVYNLLPFSPESRISDLVEEMVRAVVDEVQLRRVNADVRLYGGWFADGNLTKTAQLVAARIAGEFPRTAKFVSVLGRAGVCKINVELATSLEAAPREIFHDTYREKSVDWRVKCFGPDQFGCSIAGCILDNFGNTLKKKRCTNATCGRSINELLYRAEQKMVDTMITCDLVGNIKEEDVVVALVSNDSDFYPPVQMLASSGATVCWLLSGATKVANAKFFKSSNFKFIQHSFQ